MSAVNISLHVPTIQDLALAQPGDSKDSKLRFVLYMCKWFKDHRCLMFCISSITVFCFYCCKAPSTVFHTKTEPSFTSNSFSNWKKVKQKFHEHEQSQTCHEAVMYYQTLQQPSVVSQLSSQLYRDQVEHKMLMKLLTSLKFLVRQGLANHGHIEEGNLFQLLRYRAEDVPELQAWLRDVAYI